MAVQYCDIPFASSFKWYKNTTTPGTHFDDDWMINRIKSFETLRGYKQKWQVDDETDQQVISTIAPGDLTIYNCKKEIVGTIAFTQVLTSAGFPASVYNVLVNLNTAYNSGANPVVYLYFKCQTLDTTFEWISEPIHIAPVWRNTSVFQWYNSYNDFGAYYVNTGYRPKFRCEALIMNFKPERDRSTYNDQLRNIKTLSATPYRVFTLTVGDEKGVADWVVDTLNRIYAHDNVLANGKKYDTAEGAKWDINRPKNYPLIGAEIDIVESINAYSNQQSAGSVEPGIVTGFIIDSEFTGTAQEIQVEEITTTN